MFSHKALIWQDGQLKPKACSIEEVAQKETFTKNANGDKIKCGKQLMVRIRYPHNFGVREQWVKKERLVRKDQTVQS